MFSYNPEERMTLDQLKSHPWIVNSSLDNENMRQTLLQAAQAKTAEQNAPVQKPVKVKRNATATSRVAWTNQWNSDYFMASELAARPFLKRKL